MKMRFFVFVLLSLCLTVCGCSGNADESAEPDISDLTSEKTIDVFAEADAIISKYSLETGALFRSDSTVEGEYLDEELIRSYYGDAATVPDFSKVESYAVYIDETSPLKPCEFGIFKLKDGESPDELDTYIRARIGQKIELSVAYPTMDTTALETAVFGEKNGYYWYAAVLGGNDEINKLLEDKLS